MNISINREKTFDKIQHHLRLKKKLFWKWAWREHVCACILSHVWLFATLWTVAHQASLPMGFSRQEYCSSCHFLLQNEPKYLKKIFFVFYKKHRFMQHKTVPPAWVGWSSWWPYLPLTWNLVADPVVHLGVSLLASLRWVLLVGCSQDILASLAVSG